ncbi:MAG: hypothetical protein HOD97_03360 [Candidatus Marinimicrobia bacterium]|nr:hypothetical protein [Candidatus Neomarinimicrobiota bacterium]MBT4280641.1 hypothetical protein [Candidatus Neomarinimicrobiota bacterium]MBT4569658.1 hypothetical protein [Candidatus Neomarinimicrobiota bacterium]MBT5338941.1 hypothetical protein [Candidatus Neomarinimicrobiota bacterium]MBT5999712.1 hypothetical protein [Candidatus Neomarinimicrobiota bacterium]
MKTFLIIVTISMGHLIGSDPQMEKDVQKLKYANTIVWINLIHNPDIHLTDWKSVDLKILGEKVDELHQEIQNGSLDAWELDKSAVGVINQLKTIKGRNYQIILDQDKPVKYFKHYFSSKS